MDVPRTENKWSQQLDHLRSSHIETDYKISNSQYHRYLAPERIENEFSEVEGHYFESPNTLSTHHDLQIANIHENMKISNSEYSPLEVVMGAEGVRGLKVVSP